ncbi:MAG: hypothetical protein ACK6CT_13775 [Planctomycetia bacterium]|jgi:hypothetical protein
MHVHPAARFDTRRRRLLVAILAVAAACGPATGSAEVQTIATDAGSGIAIEVEGWAGLGTIPIGRDVGLLPVTVKITNGSSADHVWTVRSTRDFAMSTSILPDARIAVAAGATGAATLYTSVSRGWGHANFEIVGPGVVGGGFHVDLQTPRSRHGSSGSGDLLSGISKGVQAAQGNPFAKYTLSGNALDMATAPDDWRGWSSFRNVMLTAAEWRAISGGSRKAALDWVASGGRVGILSAKADTKQLEGVPAAGPDGRRRVGSGELVLIDWDGNRLTAAAVETFLKNTEDAALEKLLGEYRPGFGYSPHRGGSTMPGTWDKGFGELANVFGPRTLPMTWILGFLSVFAIVAGPVNVLVFARQHRSRMFWTTPAISLAATAFLLGLMFLKDGVGGAGARRILGLLAPEQNSLAVIEEDFSRTGVLLGSSFPIDEPAWLQPLAPDGQEQFIEVDARMRRGDWFRSRSDQAFLATAVRPSRARVELTETDGKPAVISSIDVDLPLDRLFVIDDEGRHWTATDVGKGEKKTLQPSDAEAFRKFFASLREDAGPVRAAALDRLANLRGYAYASTRGQVGKVAVETLPAIRWIDERADFIAPLTKTRTAP